MRALCRHDPGDAGGRKHVALGHAPCKDEVERLRHHGDEAHGARGAGGDLLARHVDHAGLALVVEVAETRRHWAASARVNDPVRSARVAAATSSCRIRLSPTRKARTPEPRQAVEVGMGEDAALGDDDAVRRHARREALGRGKRRGEALEVAVVDADERRVEAQRPVELGLVMHLGENVHAESARCLGQAPCGRIVNGGENDEDAIGAERARLDHLIGIEHKVLAQDREPRRVARGGKISGEPLEGRRVGQDRKAGRAAFLIGTRERGRIEIGADQSLRGARLLDLGNEGVLALGEPRPQRVREGPHRALRLGLGAQGGFAHRAPWRLPPPCAYRRGYCRAPGPWLTFYHG